MKSSIVPQVAFLGVCDRVSKVRNVDPSLVSFNLLGLRSEVIGPIYPLPTRSLQLVFAAYRLATLSKLHVVGVGSKSKQEFSFKVDLHVHPAGEIPAEPTALQEMRIRLDPSWTIMTVPFDVCLKQVLLPDRFEVFLEEENDRILIGVLEFLYAPAPALTADRIAAIRSDPEAAKSIRMMMSCDSCGHKIITYCALERSEKLEGQGATWYKDLPERFTCNCGSPTIDLRMLRESFHSLLGEKLCSEGDDLIVTRLYEVGAIETIAERFEKLLRRNPAEAELQKFLEDYPLLFHRFSPGRIIRKAPILNRFVADFAILSRTGELYLIEIEKAGERLMKKDGGRTAQLTHAFDQVRDWLHTIHEHRATCLDCMNMKSNEVAAIRGVVIIGKDKGYDQEQLRKLKATDFGSTLFLTYDDLARSLRTVVSGVKRL